MPFFAGLASGFNTALEQDRQLAAQQAEAKAGRENAVLTHLASEHPDPEIRAQALLGLTDQRLGKSRGWKGFMNGYEGNPNLPKLRALIGGEGAGGGQPAGAGVPQGAPGAPASTAQPSPATVAPATPAAPGAPASTALPAAATGQIGPTNAAPAAAPPPGPGAVPQRGGGYLDPNVVARNKAAATAGGAVTGHLDAVSPYLTPDQRTRAALAQAGIHGNVSMRFVPGVVPGSSFPEGTLDVDNNPITPTGYYRTQEILDPITQTVQRVHIPAAPPVALQVKPTYQTLAGPEGRPHVFRVMPDNTKVDLGEKPVRDGYITGTDTATGEQYSIPAPAVFERPRGGGAVGAAPPAAAPPPGAAGAAPGAVPGAGGIPPAGGRTPGAATPPPGPAAAGLPRGAISRGRTKDLVEKEGAYLGPDGQPQMGVALYDAKGGGKYYDPRDPTKEIAGFIPGKDAAEAVKVIAQTTTIESTIDRAIDALVAAGVAEDTDPNTTAKLANKYYAGKGDDPLATATQALSNFVKIQAGSAYMQGTRSFQYVKQIQDHLPVSPGVREAALNRLTGGLAGPTSTVARLAGGKDMAWDSPKQMIEKLQQAKTSLAQVRQGFTQATGKVAERATKGPAKAAGAAGPVGAAAAPAGPVYAWDPQGVRHVQTDPSAPLPAGWTTTPPK